MAVGNWYIDAAAGADTNGGSSEGAAKETGTAGSTNSTATVSLDAGSDLSGVVVGDAIRLSAEGGAGIRGTDVFEITAVNDGADTVDVTPTPGTNAGQTWAIGGAFATIQRGCDVLQASETVHIKASANYGEAVTLPGQGSATTFCTIAGYTTNPGDGGVATNDGSDAIANGFTFPAGSYHYQIWNIRATQFTARGFNGPTADYVCLYNCRGDNNGTDGANLDDYATLHRCHFHDNSADGAAMDASGLAVDCIFEGNGTDGLEMDQGIAIGCLFIGNNNNAINFLLSGYAVAINCTIDGTGKVTNTGLAMAAGNSLSRRCVQNTIVYDCATGMTGLASCLAKKISSCNLVNANTTDYSNFETNDGEQTGAPAFENEGAGDYTLGGASPARNAGCDCGEAPGATAFTATGPDIGALTNVETAGGGGLLMPNKRAGKQ